MEDSRGNGGLKNWRIGGSEAMGDWSRRDLDFIPLLSVLYPPIRILAIVHNDGLELPQIYCDTSCEGMENERRGEWENVSKVFLFFG